MMNNKKLIDSQKRGLGLDVEEQKKFTRYLLNKSIQDEPYKNIFLLQMYMGLRIGESLALQSDDINLNNNLIRINKILSKNQNGDITFSYLKLQPRYVPILPCIKELIVEQKKLSKNNANNMLFVSKDGDYVNSLAVSHKLRQLINECNIRSICPHELRNTCCRRWTEIGVHPAIIFKWLGIKGIKPIFKISPKELDKWENEELKKINNYYNDNDFFSNSKIKNIVLDNFNMEI